MRDAPIDDVGLRHAMGQGVQTRIYFGQHTAVDYAIVFQCTNLVRVERGQEFLIAVENSCHIGEK